MRWGGALRLPRTSLDHHLARFHGLALGLVNLGQDLGQPRPLHLDEHLPLRDRPQRLDQRQLRNLVREFVDILGRQLHHGADSLLELRAALGEHRDGLVQLRPVLGLVAELNHRRDKLDCPPNVTGLRAGAQHAA